MRLAISQNEKGVSIIAAVFIITVLAFMGVMFVSFITTSSLTALNDLQSTQALYIAEGGLERALMFLEDGGLCSQITATFSAPTALGDGSFTVTGTQYQPLATTLSAGIDDAVTTIPVDGVAGFAPSGWIAIEGEFIEYTSINGSQFVGCTRGADGTTKTTHLFSMSVIQNQCDITATGTMGAGSFSNARRQVRVSVWQ